jgi:hypothetical protein
VGKMTDEERMAQVAKRAAEETLNGLFTRIGVNVEEPFELQKDFAWLRSARNSTSSAWSTIRTTVISHIVAFALVAMLFMISFKGQAGNLLK